MTTSALMGLGTRAMAAAYAQLHTTGNNIANANVAGYSRQTVQLATTEGQFSGAGFIGRGVTVQTVARANNLFLSHQASATASTAQADATRLNLMKQLERVFGSGDAGLGAAATQLFNAFSDLAASPADLSARQAVLGRAEALASLVRSDSGQIEGLQASVTSDLRAAVGEVNTLAAEVAKLNGRIAEALSQGHTPNDLLDHRDQLIQSISEKIEVHTIGSGDGSVSLFIAGGQSLVLGSSANKLLARPDAFDPSRVGLAASIAGQVVPLATRSLGGGSLAGLLNFQDSELADARSRLGRGAAALASAVNQQQSFGLDLSGAAGGPLFSIGASLALPAASNAKSGGAFSAIVGVTITDGKALKASEYQLENDPAAPGLYRLTRLSDGQVFGGLASGDGVDGFSFAIGAPAPAAGDKFLVKPSSLAAGNFALAVKDPRAIAAANPVTAVAGATNSGTAAIASLAISAAPTAPYSALTLRFNDAAGNYDLLDSASAVVSSGTWSAGTPITFNGISLALSGVPAALDTFAIAPTASPRTNNGNALALDGLAGALLVDGQTVSDDYATTLANVGDQALGAEAAAATSGAVAARAQQALTGETGVNLDEEAAKLIQYQQAYQAAAKMIQTAQTLMDTLLTLGR